MKVRALFPSILLAGPASAADILQVDAGAPGMDVAVHVLRSGGGFSGSEAVTTNCSDIEVGPVWIHSGAGGHVQGINPNFLDAGGHGGEGRVRVDGTAPPTLQSGPTGATAPTFQGCVVTNVEGTTLSTASVVAGAEAEVVDGHGPRRAGRRTDR
jgi:hypothetical protein